MWLTVCYAGWNETDDEHTVVRNMQRNEINILSTYPKESIQHTEHGESVKSRILREIVHQVGFIYKIVQGWTVNKT